MFSFYVNMCMDIFGPQYNADFIRDAVKATNAHYGGAAGYKVCASVVNLHYMHSNEQGTNVVMPNGDLDPWHALGRYTTDYYEQVYYLIAGTTWICKNI